MAAFWLALPTVVEAQMEFSLDEVEEEEPQPAKDSESSGDLIEELAAGKSSSEREGPDGPQLWYRIHQQ